MSIYSGFSTRALETAYNTSLLEIVKEMQSFIIEAIRRKREWVESQWAQEFCSSFDRLKKLEKQKYLIPYFSEGLKELSSILKANFSVNLSQISEKPSMSYISSASLNKDSGVRSSSKGNRYSSLHSARSRESKYGHFEGPQKPQRKGNIKHYQDQILKSILKDLSNPIN